MTDERKETLKKLDEAIAKAEALERHIDGSIEGALLVQKAQREVTALLKQALAELAEDVERDGV